MQEWAWLMVICRSFCRHVLRPSHHPTNHSLTLTGASVGSTNHSLMLTGASVGSQAASDPYYQATCLCLSAVHLSKGQLLVAQLAA